jgi:hypothetical protein
VIVTFTLTGESKHFTSTLTLYTDDGGLREIPLTIEVRPQERPPE